jgi:plastocyanin
MQRTIVGMLIVTALVVMTAPVLAGGYAVVRLDEEPGDVPVDTPWKIGFMVRQHDITPTNDVTAIVRAQHKETGETIAATGEQEGPVGHFVAEITFPLAGEWKWAIYPEPFAETSFETLLVVDQRSPLTTAALDEPVTPLGETLSVEIAGGGNAEWTFAPLSLEVARGTAVSWVNETDAAHTVTGDDLAFDDSGLIEPGQSFSQTFDEPGIFHYRCAPHPWMEGTVTVS